MYKLYVGYIFSIDTKKSDGKKVTTYTVHMASDSLYAPKNKIFKNIYHSYTSDPTTSDGIYGEGTKVIFMVDEANQGFIINAVDKNPGTYRTISATTSKNPVPDNMLDDIDTGNVPLTESDWIQKKMNGWVALLYSGLIWLRSKKGVEIIINPVLDMIELLAKKFSIRVGPPGLEHGALNFDFDKRNGKANFSVLVTSDTTGLDSSGTISMFKMGQHADETKKVSFFLAKNIAGPPEANKILDVNVFSDGKITIDCQRDILNLEITPDGRTILKAKSLDIDINNTAKFKINEDGTSNLKTKNFSLGDGETNQSFIRGAEFKANYDNLLDLIKFHTHPSLGIPSPELQSTLPLKKLLPGKELSNKHKLD